jgi:hypothetical protein
MMPTPSRLFVMEAEHSKEGEDFCGVAKVKYLFL